MINFKVFKKHKRNNRYWDVKEKMYVTKSEIPAGSLVVDHTGREIQGF